MTADEKLEWVEHFFDTDASGFCGDCVHFRKWREPHGEWLAGCQVLDGEEKIDLCPALRAELYDQSDKGDV